MTANQLGSLALLLGLLVVVGWVIGWLVPALAVDRMLIQLSEIRSVLEDLTAGDPTVRDNRDVQRLDERVAAMIRAGNPIGLSTVIPTFLIIHRVGAQHVPMDRPNFEGLRPSDARLLGVLERWAVREIIRGTFMASRLWFLTFPGWLLIRHGLRERVQPLQSTETETEADDIVMASLYMSHIGGGTPAFS